MGAAASALAVAKKLKKAGWDVTAIDENEEALARLGEHWSGGFVVGHGMDVNVLREAGIEEADAVVVATNGDNTNIVVGQVAQKRFGIECTVVRILDPARAELYATLGLRTVSPDLDRDRGALGGRQVLRGQAGPRPARPRRCSSSSRAGARSARTWREGCGAWATR